MSRSDHLYLMQNAHDLFKVAVVMIQRSVGSGLSCVKAFEGRLLIEEFAGNECKQWKPPRGWGVPIGADFIGQLS